MIIATMSLRSFVSLMAVGTVLAWAAWALILLNVNPFETSLAGLALFYVTLAAGIVGAVTLALTFIRVGLLRRAHVPGREIKIAFRHALLFMFVAIFSLILSAHGWVHTWHLVALVALAALAEGAVRISQARK